MTENLGEAFIWSRYLSDEIPVCPFCFCFSSLCRSLHPYPSHHLSLKPLKWWRLVVDCSKRLKHASWALRVWRRMFVVSQLVVSTGETFFTLTDKIRPLISSLHCIWICPCYPIKARCVMYVCVRACAHTQRPCACASDSMCMCTCTQACINVCAWASDNMCMCAQGGPKGLKPDEDPGEDRSRPPTQKLWTGLFPNIPIPTQHGLFPAIWTAASQSWEQTVLELMSRLFGAGL